MVSTGDPDATQSAIAAPNSWSATRAAAPRRQIYTNRFAGERFRSSAQGLITLATYGVGILIGSLISGPIVDSFVSGETNSWTPIWLIPAAIAVAVMVIFVLLFREDSAVSENAEEVVAS